VVTGADHDIGHLINALGDLMGVETFDGEGDYPHTILRVLRCIHVYTTGRLKPTDDPAGKHFLVTTDLLHADTLQVVHCNPKPDAAGNIAGPGLVPLVTL
jgi:hypothetical protein